MRSVIICIHIVAMLAYFWLFPNLDGEAEPMWTRLLLIVWSLIGIVSIIGILLEKQWSKALAYIFYGFLAIQCFIKVGAAAIAGVGGYIIGFFIVSCIALFPILLIRGICKNASQQLAQPDASSGSR